MSHTEPDHNRLRRRLLERLVEDYRDQFSVEVISQVWNDSHSKLSAAAKITTFVPTLADRLARQRLEARSQVDGRLTKTVPEILFVCVHNAGRSQMAAALAQHYGADRIHVRTAGSQPTGQIHPHVVQIMKQSGLSVGDEFPKPLTDEVLAAADAVITMGCGDSCPVLPGRHYEDWTIADPMNADTASLAAIFDDIDLHVKRLLTTLLPDLPLTPLTGRR